LGVPLIFASLAEFERDLIRERTRAGLDADRRRGRVGGRKTVLTAAKERQACRMLAEGATNHGNHATVELAQPAAPNRLAHHRLLGLLGRCHGTDNKRSGSPRQGAIGRSPTVQHHQATAPGASHRMKGRGKGHRSGSWR